MSLLGVPSSVLTGQEPGRSVQLAAYLPKSLLTKFFTLAPADSAPSLTLFKASSTWGWADFPASSSFSPVTLAPSVTVLPTPLAVSSTPRPTCLAPLSTCLVAESTCDVSAAQERLLLSPSHVSTARLITMRCTKGVI